MFVYRIVLRYKITIENMVNSVFIIEVAIVFVLVIFIADLYVMIVNYNAPVVKRNYNINCLFSL